MVAVLAVLEVPVRQEIVQKEKLMQYLHQRTQKRQKKKKKRKKLFLIKENRMDLNQQNRKEETLNEFLKKKDLKKWHQVIDMLSSEDLEAIDILITQRRSEEEAALDKEIKEEPEQKPVLKGGKQTDGSCDRTTGTATDANR